MILNRKILILNKNTMFFYIFFHHHLYMEMCENIDFFFLRKLWFLRETQGSLYLLRQSLSSHRARHFPPASARTLESRPYSLSMLHTTQHDQYVCTVSGKRLLLPCYTHCTYRETTSFNAPAWGSQYGLRAHAELSTLLCEHGIGWEFEWVFDTVSRESLKFSTSYAMVVYNDPS